MRYIEDDWKLEQIPETQADIDYLRSDGFEHLWPFYSVCTAKIWCCICGERYLAHPKMKHTCDSEKVQNRAYLLLRGANI